VPKRNISYLVRSQTDKNVAYTVALGKEPFCSCPDHDNGHKCKHMRPVTVRTWLPATRRQSEIRLAMSFWGALAKDHLSAESNFTEPASTAIVALPLTYNPKTNNWRRGGLDRGSSPARQIQICHFQP
jgi:hypothetical protein